MNANQIFIFRVISAIFVVMQIEELNDREDVLEVEKFGKKEVYEASSGHLYYPLPHEEFLHQTKTEAPNLSPNLIKFASPIQ